jgi:GTP pyrophosphokinase
MAHVMAVGAIALQFGADEDEAIAALLHDAIEDAPEALGANPAGVVRGWIRMKFGERVLAIVEACTDADTSPKPPWRLRKEQYIASIAHKDGSAVLVSAADKLHNARALVADFRQHGDRLWDRFNPDAGRDGTVGYYRALVDAFRTRAGKIERPAITVLLDELRDAVVLLETETGYKGGCPSPTPLP